MGHLPISRRQYLPRVLPGVHVLPQPVQREGFCDQLYFTARFRIIHHCVQVLAQDELDQAGRYGHLDWEERIRGRGDVQAEDLVVAH